MYQKNDRINLDFKKIIRHAFFCLLFLGVILFLRWIVLDIFKPQEKAYIVKSRYAYRIIQKELAQMYKKQGYIYNSSYEEVDNFCEILKKKYAKSGDCSVKQGIVNDGYIKLKKGSITIHGFNNPPQYVDNIFVKDIYIDTNGEKGENKFGVDRAPIRLYSTGRLGGMITPINCNQEDWNQYYVPYSPICPKDVNINFMDSEIPFAFSILQIGSKSGRSRYLSKNISYLRADCVAFGGDLTGASEYCDYRKYQWLTACYHEYRCAIELLKSHN